MLAIACVDLQLTDGNLASGEHLQLVLADCSSPDYVVGADIVKESQPTPKLPLVA